eukprot:m51a1_g1499 hypothetical protein (192) ;mRNA; r:347160-348174
MRGFNELSCEKCGKPVHVVGPTEETLEALRGTDAPEKLLFHVQARCSSSSLHLRSQVCLVVLLGDFQAVSQPFKVLARFVPHRSRSMPLVSDAPPPTSVPSAPLQSPRDRGETAAEQQSRAVTTPALWNAIDQVEAALRHHLSRMPQLLSQEFTQFEDLIIVVARFSEREAAVRSDAETARCLGPPGAARE